MKKFKIENNMPMPPLSHGRRAVYPFAQLEIGQSFDCDTDKVVQAAYKYGKRNGKRFYTAKIDRNGKTVWRCKRIS